jgi:uncharacterized protein YqfB (UPF0267 family)
MKDFREWKTKLLNLAMTEGKFGLDHPMGSCCYRDLIRDAKSNEALKDAWDRIIVKGEDPMEDTVQRIKLFPDLFKKVREGTKTATTRLGLKDYKLGPAFIQNVDSPEDLIAVEVTSLQQVKFSKISDELAQIEDYECAEDLKKKLVHIYGDKITDDTVMTVAYFNKPNDIQ